MPTLYRSAYFRLEQHVASRHVRLVRTAAAFANVEIARGELDACFQTIETIETARIGILLDWRAAPLARDAELVAALVEGTERIAKRFTRSAMLVSTQVGKLQSIRLNRSQSQPPTTFDDEAAAFEFVTQR